MDVDEVLRALRAKGTAQNRKIYARHGYGENQFGVSVANLRALAKQIGVDTGLARGLWETGNEDARILATMIADGEDLTPREFDAWVGDVRHYVLADAFSGLVARSSHARSRAERWANSKEEFVGQAGWNLLGLLARSAPDLSDADLLERIGQIEKNIHRSPNRTRHAMNMALIAIGGYRASLRARAIAAAKRIGRVEVDHGETGCETPDAASYIEKMAARAGKKK